MNSTGLSPSREAKSCSVSQEFCNFMVPKSPLPFSQVPAIGPYPKPHESNQHLPILFKSLY
jgi:hypothetical protein